MAIGLAAGSERGMQRTGGSGWSRVVFRTIRISTARRVPTTAPPRREWDGHRPEKGTVLDGPVARYRVPATMLAA